MLNRRNFVWALTTLASCGYSRLSASELEPSLETLDESALLSDIHRRTFNYFWETTDNERGLTPDRWPTRTFSSIAAIGFAFNAYIIGVRAGYITREQAAQRTRNTLKFLYEAPQGPEATGTIGHKGFFYHFLDYETGLRYRQTELSTVDTSLLILGSIAAAEFFNQNNQIEAEIRSLVQAIYERIDWQFMLRRSGKIGMGWHPETGYIASEWRGFSEGSIVYLLAFASRTHPIAPAAWQRWTSTYNQTYGKNFGSLPHVGYFPLFVHQYPNVWYDFRDMQDTYMKRKGLDYFENSRRATLAQREYAIKNPNGYKDYGPDIWGMTACDGPADVELVLNRRRRFFRTYSARGQGSPYMFDDGTIAPTAAISSIVFTPELSIRAARAMLSKYGGDIYGRFGFHDSFNPTYVTNHPSTEGRQVPIAGWVSNDYLGIDQGPILSMIENYQHGTIWNLMKQSQIIKTGLLRAGFTQSGPRSDWLFGGS
jgi:hypothetical protein